MDLPNPEIEQGPPALQVDSLTTELSENLPSHVDHKKKVGFTNRKNETIRLADQSSCLAKETFLLLSIQLYIYIYVWVLSHVQLFASLWTVVHQAPLPMGAHGICQVRILEWVAISFSRRSS